MMSYETEHHIQPTSQGHNGYITNIKINKKRITDTIHQSLHGLFGNLPVHEQLLLFYSIIEQILGPKVKYKMTEIFALSKKEFYTEEILCEPYIRSKTYKERRKDKKNKLSKKHKIKSRYLKEIY